MAAADAVLAGERHPMVQNAKFFHTAGLNFPYPNMHYVLKAGGNAFYEKRGREERAAKGVRPQSQLVAAGRVEGKQARVQVAAAPQPASHSPNVSERRSPDRPSRRCKRRTPAVSADPATEALSFAVDQAKADAIGALILDQTRTGSID